MSGYATYEVRNEPPPLEGFNAWAVDLPLREAVTVFGAGWAEARMTACGARIGSARVQALALLRAEIGRAKGAHPALDAWLAAPLPAPEERNAHRLTEQLALALAASLLLRYAPSYVAGAYCATRLGHAGGYAPGTPPESVDCAPIIARVAAGGEG